MVVLTRGVVVPSLVVPNAIKPVAACSIGAENMIAVVTARRLVMFFLWVI